MNTADPNFDEITNELVSAFCARTLDDALLAKVLHPHLDDISFVWSLRNRDDRLDELTTSVHFEVAAWMSRHPDAQVQAQGDQLLRYMADDAMEYRECCEGCWWANIRYAERHAVHDPAGALERLYVCKREAPGDAMNEARIQLARIWATGAGGLPVDLDEVESLIGASCEHDDGAGAYRLGMLFDTAKDGAESNSTTPDLPLAADFYAMAEEFGHVAARTRLGTMLVCGLVEIEGYTRKDGIEMLRKAANAGSAEAKAELSAQRGKKTA